jgi:hypothetical protein
MLRCFDLSYRSASHTGDDEPTKKCGQRTKTLQWVDLPSDQLTNKSAKNSQLQKLILHLKRADNLNWRIWESSDEEFGSDVSCFSVNLRLTWNKVDTSMNIETRGWKLSGATAVVATLLSTASRQEQFSPKSWVARHSYGAHASGWTQWTIWHVGGESVLLLAIVSTWKHTVRH